MRNPMRYPKTCFFVLCLFCVFLSGKILDNKADRLISQLYPRDNQGVIDCMQSITKIQNYPNALVLLHGFQSSPDTWNELVSDLNGKIQADIYAPLLPFHGKDLKTLSTLDIDILEKKLQENLNILSKTYQSVTVVGFSLSGALLSSLAAKNTLAKNIHIVLYNPALYLKRNTLPRRTEMRLYSLWRQYCNYAFLGCYSPNYASGDSVAKPKIAKQKSLKYDVVPAALQVYNLDLKNRNNLANTTKPYDLIISKDDNYFNYHDQKKACEANSTFCKLHTFESGKHIIHWGAHKTAFEDLMVHLVGQKSPSHITG